MLRRPTLGPKDVTRDTYGFQAPSTLPTDAGQRIANAEREAEQAGIPGVELPNRQRKSRRGSNANLF